MRMKYINPGTQISENREQKMTIPEHQQGTHRGGLPLLYYPIK